MKLKPCIASYNSNYMKAQAYLTDEVLDFISSVALTPIRVENGCDEKVQELIEMHVLREDEGELRLNTTVFLEQDIINITKLAKSLGSEFAKTLVDANFDVKRAPSVIRNFLVGTVAITQGLSSYMRRSNLGSAWKSYCGSYARTKVDFDQECESLNQTGVHLFNKAIIHGENYSAVMIGPGGRTFGEPFRGLLSNPEQSQYVMSVLRFLTDSFGQLLEGKLDSEHLNRAAKLSGLWDIHCTQNIIVTQALYDTYKSELDIISQSVSAFYEGKLPIILHALADTTAGQQGVAAESMLMHFWRYFSKILAISLYEVGFLTDDVPESGAITVFFKRDILELVEAFE